LGCLGSNLKKNEIKKKKKKKRIGFERASLTRYARRCSGSGVFFCLYVLAPPVTIDETMQGGKKQQRLAHTHPSAGHNTSRKKKRGGPSFFLYSA
jgi:hypothetical protein